MNSSFELLCALKAQGYVACERDPLWWPHSGTFWVILGAILTQQTKWERVEESLLNLETLGVKNLETLHSLDVDSLSVAIRPSGFYNTKAKNLHRLSGTILDEFGSFETFYASVSREWLLAQKGIGEESADSILCYACHRDIMVVDAYTARLLNGFGYSFDSYEALQEWMQEGIETHKSAIEKLYAKEMSFNEIYARFHGKIVEFCKEKSRGKVVDVACLGL